MITSTAITVMSLTSVELTELLVLLNNEPTGLNLFAVSACMLPFSRHRPHFVRKARSDNKKQISQVNVMILQ